MMNSSPAAYPAAAVDPKFPPNEEYSQNNYIPDYYGTNVQSLTGQSHHLSHHPNPHHHHHHPYGYHLNYIDQNPVQTHPYSHSVHPTHHNVAPSPLGANATSLAQQHQYFPQCSMSSMGPTTGPLSHNSLHHALNNTPNQISPHHQSPLAPNQIHISSRVSSPLITRTPSPRQQNLGIVEPPSPPDCAVSTNSGSDSGTGNGHPVIYPWMKKVHVNPGKGKLYENQHKQQKTTHRQTSSHTLLLIIH